MRTVERWLGAFCAAAGTALPAQDPAAALERLVGDPLLREAHVGVQVVDLADGSEVCAHNADKAFVPASNMKLFTAAVALELLGPNFRFTTKLVALGEIENGVLHGVLHVLGMGDPTLGGRHEDHPTVPLEYFAEALESEHGIRAIRGRIGGGPALDFGAILGPGWAWDDESQEYSAQISSLCFAENCIEIDLDLDDEGKLRATLSPATSYVTIECTAKVCETETECPPLLIRRERAQNVISISGNYRADRDVGPFRVPVENPSAYAAHVLREVLDAHGIEFEPGDQAGMVLDLADYQSPPLSEILSALLKDSLNLYAEQLRRVTTGLAKELGTLFQEEASFARLGIDTSGLVYADGSGLSRYNLARPSHFTELLGAMWHTKLSDPFIAALPIAGVDGTLADRFPSFTDGPVRGRIRAKTGSMTGIVALSGYIMRADPEQPPVVFSVLINHFTCDGSQVEALVDAFVRELVPTARGR